MSSTSAAAEKPERPDLVAELEKQFGDKLTKAREDYHENQAERDRLDKRRAKLLEKKAALEADHKKRLIDHGKGVTGAAEKRAKAERELAEANQLIEAVDAAIAYESERTGALHADLHEMEARLGEAKRRQVQMEIAE